MTQGKYLTVAELSEFLHIHKTTIYRLLRQRKLPGFRIGSDWRFSLEAVEEWARDQFFFWTDSPTGNHILGRTARLHRLAVDVGLLYSTRRRMQTAADAAAIAGATALRDGQNTRQLLTPSRHLRLHQFAEQCDVTVSEPTLPSPYPSSVTYVEVDISQSVPTYFLRVLGYKSMKVGARAVSGAVAGPACIYALDPSGSGTFSVTGNANITAQCGIVDESSSSSGLSLSGNITLTATSIGVYGPGFSKSGNVTISPQPVPKIASLPDPLATQAKNAAPTVGTCSQADQHERRELLQLRHHHDA